MQERNDAWMRDYGLQGCQYDWSLDKAQLLFRLSNDEVVADICVIGSVSEAGGRHNGPETRRRNRPRWRRSQPQPLLTALTQHPIVATRPLLWLELRSQIALPQNVCRCGGGPGKIL
jgi:hypothetical protein